MSFNKEDVGGPKEKEYHAHVAVDGEERGVNAREVVGVDQLDVDAPLGSEWCARGIGIAVAAGGDGTIGSVATQIAGSEVALGILPLGTSNDTARSLGLPLDLAAAAAAIASGVPTIVDAGRVLAISSSAAADARGTYFLHALTLGMNVEFARLATDLVRGQRWGRLNYAASAL